MNASNQTTEQNKISESNDRNPDAREQKPVTIADIAKAVGVSLGTVSRVLNNRNGKIKISDSTKQKVLKASEEMGYQPNPMAAALRTKRTNVIGAVLRDIGDPFLSLVIKEVQKLFHSMGFELLLGHAEYQLETATRQVNFMLSHLFDGLFLVGNLPGDEAMIGNLKKRRTPVVALASGDIAEIPSVNFDNEYGSRIAMEYLSGLGHKRIAFVGNKELAGVDQRLRVYKQFIKEHSLYYDDAYIYPDTITRGEAIGYTRRLLSLPQPPTAIFCPSDFLAIAAMSGAWQMGRQVPKDVSIIGYDDIEEAADAYIPLTTIRQSTELIAKNAIDLLLKMINNNAPDIDLQKKVVLEPELVIRGSCGAPK